MALFIAVDPATGTGSMVSLAISAGRAKAGPRLSPPFDSGTDNGSVGCGWPLSLAGDVAALCVFPALPASRLGSLPRGS